MYKNQHFLSGKIVGELETKLKTINNITFREFSVQPELPNGKLDKDTIRMKVRGKPRDHEAITSGKEIFISYRRTPNRDWVNEYVISGEKEEIISWYP